jgi:1-acyl-sn-glycerol-3-phosphate acyltransferase
VHQLTVVKRERPEERLPIKLLRAGNVLFTRLYHHLEVQTPSRLPYRGAGILVCNHVSGLDPLLIQAPCNRLITWMMAAEYYKIRSIAWVFRAVGAIPVQRSGRDTTATRAALRTLEQGGILGVFPEGRIETSRQLLPFQTGVAMMAIKTGVPVYPAYLDGSQRGKEMVDAFLTPNRAVLRFGPPVQLAGLSTSRKGLEEGAEQIRQAVISLRPEVIRASPGPGRRWGLAKGGQ